jgi:hypothetical protein
VHGIHPKAKKATDVCSRKRKDKWMRRKKKNKTKQSKKEI